jgi:hypothetical protein
MQSFSWTKWLIYVMTSTYNDYNMASKRQLKNSFPLYKLEIIRPIDLEFFQLAVEIFQSMIHVFKQ